MGPAMKDEANVLLRGSRTMTLTTLVRSRALEHGEKLAIADAAMRVTFADLDGRTDRLAAALVALGVGKGDRIAMLLLDSLASIELMIACGKLGAIALPMNWRLAAAELAHIVETSAPRLFFHSSRFGHLVPETGTFTRLDLPDVTPSRGIYEDLIANADAITLPDVRDDDALFMLYTSGTTGQPKGCLQSHGGATGLAMAFALRLGLTPSDRLICTSPLFHVGGLGHVFAAIAAGAGMIIAPRGANPEDVLRLISDEGCTFGSTNDALVDGLCEAQARLRLPIAMRTITRGSSITPAKQIDAIRNILNAEVVGGYGQTEALGFALMLDGEAMQRHPAALGWPLPHFEAAVLDGEGIPVKGPASGELGLRGPAVMLGYWRNPEATRQTLGTGWLRTGDLVRRDDTGLFHFEGRSRELIKSGGENVYPREVERVLLTHPSIADVAIIGVPDARWGEAVKACIVLGNDAVLAPAEAVAWCRDHIAGYKRPRYVEFVDAIPRDHLNKIQRPLLQQRPVTPDQAIG